MSFNLITYFTVLLMVIRSECMATRNLTMYKTPGCKGSSCQYNIFYVRADGPNDTIHYLWDFDKKPTVSLALTKPNNSLTIDWPSYAGNGSIAFEKTPDYSILVIVDKLIEFEDTHDTGLLSNDTRNSTFDTSDFDWSPNDSWNASGQSGVVFLEMHGACRSNTSLQGSVIIKLKAFSDTDHEDILPRLFHSSNTTQINLALINLTSNANLTNSRWATNLLVISSDSRSETPDIQSKRSVDDEYSPGDFRVVNVVTPKAEETNGGYLQWRPVVYTTGTPSIANSSEVAVMDPVPGSSSLLNGTLAFKLRSVYLNLDTILIENIVVSFGSSEDGFYKKTNYSTWTFLLSYGPPQVEGFSMLVILIMSIGLGLPALLIAIGSVFICVRRLSSNKDELSLER